MLYRPPNLSCAVVARKQSRAARVKPFVPFFPQIFRAKKKEERMENRAVGVIAIIVKNRAESANLVNEELTKFGNIVIGRMGLPYHERDLNIITLIVDASTDQIGALTGKLGLIPDVTVKSTLAKI